MRVTIIGGGQSGIVAMKCMLEEGIQPVCFERTGHFGGLWRYHEDDVHGLPSVMKTTVINTSKEMGALSDFVPDENLPNYMHNTEIYQMFTDYVKKHDLEKHIRYNKDVIKVEKAENYDTTGRIKVTTKDNITQEVETDDYDGCLVCTGHHVYPNIPSFPGQDKFKGTIMHTHSLKKVDGFADQVVVVVGVGNSGMDAAVEISHVAKQVYLCTRRGTWVIPRVGPSGMPFDLQATSRFKNLQFQLTPLIISAWSIHKSLNQWFDHSMYNLQPKHFYFGQHPTVSDTLPVKLLTGVVKIRKNIKKFTENGVIFENETEEFKVDSVVFATGYKIQFPFLSEELTVIKDNRVHLYKFMYPPHLLHNTLAMIGLVQSVGALFPIGEAQLRLAALVLKGKVKLPNKDDMEADIRRYKEEIDRRYVKTQRHTIQVDYIPYLDDICQLFGAKPDLSKYLFSDPKLFLALLFGPSLPYQYRLQGPHTWPGARDAILNYKRRIMKPLKKDCDRTSGQEKSVIMIAGFLFVIFLFGHFLFRF